MTNSDAALSERTCSGATILRFASIYCTLVTQNNSPLPDVSGKIRIWDTVNPEHILKAEYPCIGGPIKDLDWSPDSQKIVCGGEGKEKFGK